MSVPEPITRKEQYLHYILNNGGGGGGSAILGEKSVTENGVYNATDDAFDGYSTVTVNVNSSTAPEIYLSKTDPVSSIGSDGDIYAKYIENGVEWISDSSYYVYDANTVVWETGSDKAIKKYDGTAICVCVHFIGMMNYGGVAMLVSTVERNVDVVIGSSSDATYSAEVDGIMWYTQRAVYASTKESVPFPVYSASCSRDEFQTDESKRAETIAGILQAAQVEQSLEGCVKFYQKENGTWAATDPIMV